MSEYCECLNAQCLSQCTTECCPANCTCCCNCSDYNRAVAGAAIMAIFFVLETVLVGVAIGLIIWKRINVAKFLLNLQLPKLRDVPQLVIQKLRPSSESTPPPEVYVERTVKNPTYDIEEGVPSDTSDKAKEPIELYEEIPPEEGTSNLEEFEDNCVYDVPEALENDQLETYASTDVPGEEVYETAYATTDIPGEEMLHAYATTDVSSGGDMLKAYAITDVSQTEGMCNAYAVTDAPERRSGSGSQQVVSAEVHADRSNSNESKVRANAGPQTMPQKNADTATRVKNVGVQLPTLTAPQKLDANDNKDRTRVKTVNTPPTKQQKEGTKPTNKASLRGKPTMALKPALHPKPAGVKEKSGAETSKKVTFEDEERRRSKSYTGTHWESIAQAEQSNKSSTKSSIKGKPKPLPKKKGIGLIRNRGASDSGVEGYSKLDLKSTYASLEPHMKQETNGKDAMDTKTMQDSYSRLKH